MSNSDNDDRVDMSGPPAFPIVLHIAHCIFPADGRMVHWTNDNPKELYVAFPRLFVASIMRDVQGGRVVAGCCLFATDLEQDRPDFKEKLLQIVENVPKMKEILEEKPRLICVQLVRTQDYPAEASIQQVFNDQYVKRGVGGRG